MPPTAYFVFCQEKRAEVREQLVAEGNAKVSVTTVAQALGQRWKALTDEERQSYKDQAARLAEEAAAAKAEAGPGAEEDGAAADEPAGPKQDHIPVSWVRKVLAADPEVARCSGDAGQVLAGMAEVLLAVLCKKAAAVAQRSKRRTLKLEDLEAVIKGDRRLHALGLRDVCTVIAEQQLQNEQEQDQQGEEPEGVVGAGAKPAAAAQNKKPKLASHSITKFFAAAT